MLHWKLAHAQVLMCTYSTESMHICSTESVRILIWKRAHAQWNPHNFNDSLYMLKCKYAHTQLKACTCSNVRVHDMAWDDSVTHRLSPTFWKWWRVVHKNRAGFWNHGYAPFCLQVRSLRLWYNVWRTVSITQHATSTCTWTTLRNENNWPDKNLG